MICDPVAGWTRTKSGACDCYKDCPYIDEDCKSARSAVLDYQMNNMRTILINVLSSSKTMQFVDGSLDTQTQNGGPVYVFKVSSAGKTGDFTTGTPEYASIIQAVGNFMGLETAESKTKIQPIIDGDEAGINIITLQVKMAA